MKENFVVDNRGKKIAVQIAIMTYEKLKANSDELEDISEYRKAKACKSDPIPFEQVFNEFEDADQ